MSKASQTVLIFFPPFFYRFDCAVTESGSFCVGFHNMCCGFAKVRRLSTASSVTKPPHFILTTEWIWYWKDEYDMWQEYGKQVSVEKLGRLLTLCEKRRTTENCTVFISSLSFVTLFLSLILYR